MRILRGLVWIMFGLGWSGCAYTGRTASDSMETSLYKVNAIGGSRKVSLDAVNKAKAYCVEENKRYLFVKHHYKRKANLGIEWYSYDLYFTCVDEGDPRLAMPPSRRLPEAGSSTALPKVKTSPPSGKVMKQPSQVAAPVEPTPPAPATPQEPPPEVAVTPPTAPSAAPPATMEPPAVAESSVAVVPPPSTNAVPTPPKEVPLPSSAGQSASSVPEPASALPELPVPPPVLQAGEPTPVKIAVPTPSAGGMSMPRVGEPLTQAPTSLLERKKTAESVESPEKVTDWLASLPAPLALSIQAAECNKTDALLPPSSTANVPGEAESLDASQVGPVIRVIPGGYDRKEIREEKLSPR